MKLENERIILRPIAKQDAVPVLEYRADKIANAYQGWIPENLEEVETFIEKNPAEFNQPESWFQLVILEKETGNLVGDIGVHFFGEENLQVEFGITLDKAFQGKALASESLNLLINYLFKDLKKHRIMASLDPRNTASEKLMQRLGLRKEAHFVKSYYQNGTWADDVVFAILNEEWK